MYLMEFRIRRSLREKRAVILQERSKDPAKSDRLSKIEKHMEMCKIMWFMVGFGLSIFLGGFAMWNLDNRYCSKLRIWRHKIGLPWGLLLEGHGWW